jgi:hypothetical protein
MEDQTRQLLALFADRIAAQVVEALAKEALDEPALRNRVRGSRQSINRRLEDLRGWGIVEFEELPPDGPGRPARHWRLVDGRILRFSNAADALALELLEGRADAQRKGIDRRRRREVGMAGDSAA